MVEEHMKVLLSASVSQPFYNISFRQRLEISKGKNTFHEWKRSKRPSMSYPRAKPMRFKPTLTSGKRLLWYFWRAMLEKKLVLIFCQENAKKSSQDSPCESISGNEVPFQSEKYFWQCKSFASIISPAMTVVRIVFSEPRCRKLENTLFRIRAFQNANLYWLVEAGRLKKKAKCIGIDVTDYML